MNFRSFFRAVHVRTINTQFWLFLNIDHVNNMTSVLMTINLVIMQSHTNVVVNTLGQMNEIPVVVEEFITQ